MVQRLNSFAKLDPQGRIINPCKSAKIHHLWRPAVARGMEVYFRLFGDAILGLYIRGSVAEGKAIRQWSDLDMFAVVREGCHLPTWKSFDSIQVRFRREFPFASGLEISLVSLADVTRQQRNIPKFLLSQSAHLFGTDYREAIAAYRPSEVFLAYRGNLSRQLKVLRAMLGRARSDRRISLLSKWIGKELVRAGMILTIPSIGQFSSDLRVCQRTFSALYPEKDNDMRSALKFVTFPTNHPTELRSAIDQFGNWLITKERRVSLQRTFQTDG